MCLNMVDVSSDEFKESGPKSVVDAMCKLITQDRLVPYREIERLFNKARV